MATEGPKGPFCQSCGMPLEEPEDFGTEAGGFRVNDYCRFCFADGAFTDPGISMQAMAAKCVSIMSEQGIMSAPEAHALMADMLPRLKRWRAPAAAVR
jgi:hypothetical protein